VKAAEFARSLVAAQALREFGAFHEV